MTPINKIRVLPYDNTPMYKVRQHGSMVQPLHCLFVKDVVKQNRVIDCKR